MPYSVASRTLAVTPIVALFDNFSASLCQFNGAENWSVHSKHHYRAWRGARWNIKGIGYGRKLLERLNNELGSAGKCWGISNQ